MKIWVDADACPGTVKEIVIRAANRVKLPAVFVANKTLRIPVSLHVSSVRVGAGLDVADSYIAAHASAHDLAVTADIPLAAALVAKGAVVINPRGELYTEENIGEVLALRDFMHGLREEGLAAGGPSGFSARDAQQFASTFDQQLAVAVKLAAATPAL